MRALFHRVAADGRSNTSWTRFLQRAVVTLQHSSHVAPEERYDLAHEEHPLTATCLSPEDREQGTIFAPKFDSAGLLTAVVVDHGSAEVLVVAHMNAEALEATLTSGKVHFWSRSRGKLWMKGETSGHVLVVEEIRVDCDQDALVIRATPAGPTCHTGARSCFYRQIDLREGGPALVPCGT
jgi:phosphoribosyl-AMP cyclohydrolase